MPRIIKGCMNYQPTAHTRRQACPGCVQRSAPGCWIPLLIPAGFNSSSGPMSTCSGWLWGEWWQIYEMVLVPPMVLLASISRDAVWQAHGLMLRKCKSKPGVSLDIWIKTEEERVGWTPGIESLPDKTEQPWNPKTIWDYEERENMDVVELETGR